MSPSRRTKRSARQAPRSIMENLERRALLSAAPLAAVQHAARAPAPASAAATAYAPALIANKIIDATLSSDGDTFSVQFLTSPAGNDYVLIGGPSGFQTTGTYTYTRTSGSTATLVFADSDPE